MSTTTTPDLMDTIVKRIRAYVNANSQSMATVASARIYARQAPDVVQFPYVLLRIINRQTDPRYNNTRETFDIEALCHNRPRSKEPTERDTEILGDLVKQALLTWKESGYDLGLSFGREARGETLPVEPAPGDAEIVTVRVVVSCASWPKYLTAALT